MSKITDVWRVLKQSMITVDEVVVSSELEGNSCRLCHPNPCLHLTEPKEGKP